MKIPTNQMTVSEASKYLNLNIYIVLHVQRMVSTVYELYQLNDITEVITVITYNNIFIFLINL